jgi:hypothetical protein
VKRNTIGFYIVVGTLALGVLIGGLISLGLGSAHHSAPSVSCQQAANAQDAYAQLADREGYLTTFTNAQMLASNEIDTALVENMVKAGCPETIRYFDMLTGQWVN